MIAAEPSTRHAFRCTGWYLLTGCVTMPLLGGLVDSQGYYDRGDAIGFLLVLHILGSLIIYPSVWITTLLASHLTGSPARLFDAKRARTSGIAIVLLVWGGLWLSSVLGFKPMTLGLLGPMANTVLNLLSIVTGGTTLALCLGWLLPRRESAR